MSRGGGRDFNKTVHHYEKWWDGKGHKIGIKMKASSDGELEFYTDHFKEDDSGSAKAMANAFKTLPELYDWIDDQLCDVHEIEWEPKLFIEVKGWTWGRIEAKHDSYKGFNLMNASLDIEAHAIEVGTTPDRQRWRRSPGNKKSAAKFEDNIGYGLEKRHRSDGDGSPYSRALIDDTIENRKMLVQFSVRFDQLRDQFFQAFAPEHVEKFLAHAAGTLLLNAPSD